jgi:hypothetical protein
LASPSIFREAFLETDAATIAASVRSEGFWYAEGVLRRHVIDAIEQQILPRSWLHEASQAALGTRAQVRFKHGLCVSRAYFEVVTHRHLRAVARACLGTEVQLASHEYVVSRTGVGEEWVRDDAALVENRRSLRIIFYACDTYEGELQLIRGSHDEARVARDDTRARDIVTLSARAGTMIVIDGRTLHRTRRIGLPDYTQGSIALAIEGCAGRGEPILVNASYIDPTDTELQRFLAMGEPRDAAAPPRPRLEALPDEDLLRIIARSAAAVVEHRLPPSVKGALPPLKRHARALLGRLGR